MSWTVPCVAGCDGPMLTTTSSSSAPRVNAGRIGFGRLLATRESTAALFPIRHERLFARFRIVLAQRVAFEAFVEQDRAQVRIAAEDDAIHVVALALHEARRSVQRHERIDDRVALPHAALHADADLVERRIEGIDALEPRRRRIV